jgi:PleD family two-component response regulator
VPARDRHPPLDRTLRVLIVDGHEISRAAHSALLRTEGLEVFDVHPDDDAVALASALRPHVVVIDATATAERVELLARTLRRLHGAPAIVITSSGDRRLLDSAPAGSTFLAKADICADTIRSALEACADARA